MPKRRRSVSPAEFTIARRDQKDSEALPYVQAYEASIIHSQPDTARRIGARHGVDEQQGGLINWTPEGLDESDGIWVDRYVCQLIQPSSALRLARHS